MARRVDRPRKRNPYIFIGVEGKNKTERIYFKNFSSRCFRFHFSTAGSTDIPGMARELLNLMKEFDFDAGVGDKSFLVIDTDNAPSRIDSIKQISPFCDSSNIEIITTGPEFEMWFLLHYKNHNIPHSKKGMIRALEDELGSKYAKSENIFSKLAPLTDIAIKNAKALEKRANFNDEPLTVPHSRVYKIIEHIRKICDQL